ncbi:MAG: class I SAM-dependent methyltransferase [Deltaproteobacteria bacterium]|nr:class I SAM-dependent methyltransferase [Deltaproteobacteria bacterium]
MNQSFAPKSVIFNRLKKNWDKLKPWADRLGIEAFRLYDRDIPEYPSIIEIYGRYAVLWDRRDPEIDTGKEHLFDETMEALGGLGFSIDEIAVKRREKQRPRATERAPSPIVPIGSAGIDENLESGGASTSTTPVPNKGGSISRPDGTIEIRHVAQTKRTQNFIPSYVKSSHEFPVREGDHKFLVNLHDYLDTGLFLDHRLTRKMVGDEIAKRRQTLGPAQRQFKMLNLFCYTGSFSVYGARAGATVTSVDMSPIYLAWAERNFIANGLLTANHRFINDDVLSWMKDGFAASTGPYDYIICDPPTFSNSKKMEGTWDISRDHKWLVERCLEALRPGGTLIFSANRRDFQMDPILMDPLPRSGLRAKEITRDTLPKDYHDAKIRRVFRFDHTPRADD